MFDKLSDFASGAFIMFYVAFSHFYEAHMLCLLAMAVGANLVVKSLFNVSPITAALKKASLKLGLQKA